MLKTVRLEPKTGQPYIFANFYYYHFWQNPYLGLEEVAKSLSGAFSGGFLWKILVWGFQRWHIVRAPPSWPPLLPYVGCSLIWPDGLPMVLILLDYFTRLVLCTTIFLD